MPRSSVLRTTLISSLLLLAGCGAPAPTASHVSIESDSGAIAADVEFEGGAKRGDNTLKVKLTSDSRAAAALTAVDAGMPAHDHHASARMLALDGDTYRATGLDLFMAGRWVVVLELSQRDEPDRASFSIDVP